MGYAGVYLFFLFLHQFIDCGYSLEPPRRGGSNGVPTTYVLSKNKKNSENYLLKIIIFYNLKNNLYLHGPVFIMKELYLFFNRCIVQGITVYNKLSRIVRKPDFCLGENKGADQLRGNREADQRLCFRYSDSTIPLLLKSEISSF